MKKNIGEGTKGHTHMQWTTALLVNFITLSYGFESGWMSPATKILQSDASPTGAPLSDSAITWIASSMSLTAAIAVPISGYICDVYGSKRGAIILTIPLALSWLLRIVYSTSTTLIIARAISGFSAGGIFNVIPMYVKEISQDDMRGILGALIVLFQNIGIFIMYTIGAYMDYYKVMYISLSLPIIVGLLMVKAPVSPLFLVKQGKYEEAAEIIAHLRGLKNNDQKVQNELEYMKKEEARFRNLPDISITAIVTEPSSLRGLILIMFVFTFRAFGPFILIIYATTILNSTGVEFNISPELQALSLPTVMIIGSLSLLVIVERFGRKVLLSGVLFISFISMVTVGITILTSRLGGTVPSWLPVSAMMVAVFMFAGGISPLPFIIMTEMFSYQIRAKVMGGVVSYVWFTSFVSIVIYTPISVNFGEYTTFFVYGGINLIGSIFVLLFLPETKRKNDEEIRHILSKKTCLSLRQDTL